MKTLLAVLVFAVAMLSHALAGPPLERVLVIVDGAPITHSDLERARAEEGSGMPARVVLDHLIGQQLSAACVSGKPKSARLTFDERRALAQEFIKKQIAPTVTPVELQSLYDRIAARRRVEPFDELKDDLKLALTIQRYQERWNALRKDAHIEIGKGTTAAPPTPAADAPSHGISLPPPMAADSAGLDPGELATHGLTPEDVARVRQGQRLGVLPPELTLPQISKVARKFKLAAAGAAVTMFELAAMLELGIGAPRSPAIAAFWYDLAARQNHATSAERLAALARKGVRPPVVPGVSR